MRAAGGTDEPGAGGVSNVVSGHVIAESLVMAQTVHMRIAAGSDPGPSRQLRSGPVVFVDRVDQRAQLAQVLAAAATSTVVVVVVGPGGAGKSALARDWLNAVKPDFPDGQFEIDFRTVSSAFEALGDLHWATRSREVRVADSLAGREADWRSWAQPRRIALLIEDPVTAADVRPLLPNSPGSLVVITSRGTLPVLWEHEPVVVRVGQLPYEAAVEMLERIVGRERVRVEPGAAAELVELCARLPLALAVVGIRLRIRPHTRVSTVVAELRGQRRLLLRMTDSEKVPLKTEYDVAYQQLSAPAADLYRALGSHPGPEFGVAVAAAAADVPLSEAREWLDELAEESLIEMVAEDRYRIHDLCWEHARDTAVEQDGLAGVAAARRVIVDWYLDHAIKADVLLMRLRWRVGPAYPQLAEEASAQEKAIAMAWLEMERPNLLAVVRLAAEHEELCDRSWRVCQALWSVCFLRKHHQDGVDSHTVGIDVAVGLGDAVVEAKLRCQRGFFFLGLGDTLRAIDDFTAALDAGRAAGDPQAESTALESLGLAALGTRQYAEALRWLDEAVGLVDDPRAVALLVHHRGRAHSGLGHHARARELLTEALTGMVSLPDAYNQARVQTSLGENELQAGRPEEGFAFLHAAWLGIPQEDAPLEQARIGVLLAIAAQRCGKTEEARTWRQEAETLYAAAGRDPKAINQQLAELGESPDLGLR